MRAEDFLAKLVSLPELKLIYVDARSRPGWLLLEFQSISECRACPKCANLSFGIYDHRKVKILDSPLRDRRVELRIRKKRYQCKICKKPFTELLHGIFKAARLTERMRRNILWCCSRYQSLLMVAQAMGCSDSTVRRSFYAHLEIHFKRHLKYPFPKKIGIDEHFFGMHSPSRFLPISEQKYHTTIIDLKAHRLYRILKEKDSSTLFSELKNEEGLDNVEDAVIDMSEGYRNLIHALFPNAKITVDKFHVLKLLVRPLNKERKKVIGQKKRKNPMSSLLLKSAYNLEYSTRAKIQNFLKPYPTLRAIYEFKERLFSMYRCHGKKWAVKSMDRTLEELKHYEQIDALKTLRKTLINWKAEILNHFDSHLTNAMTEGFNNKIKLIKRMAYGFSNPDLYNLRMLYACYH